MNPNRATATLEPLSGATSALTQEATGGQLLTAARAGDPLAWRLLVGRYDGLVRATARRFRLGEADVADVAQTTWLRLVENLGRIHEPEAVGGWLGTTAARESLVLLRRKRRESPTTTGCFEEVVDEQAVDPQARLVHDEELHAVDQAMAQLPPARRRLLLTLSQSKQPCYRRVAEVHGIPVGSIGPTRQRALRQLRVQMEQHGFPTP